MIDWKDPKKEMPVFDTAASPILLLLTKLPGSKSPVAKLGYAVEENGKITFEFHGMWNSRDREMAEEVIAWSEVNYPDFVNEIDDPYSFWSNYNFKKSTLTLIRAHYEDNEEAFEKECENISNAFYYTGEIELHDYVMAQIHGCDWTVN